MSAGAFGIAKESRIVASRVREIFTPHSPVDDIAHFFGREDEASRFVSVINTQGQHVLVYGDRGVGKTSLAVTTCKVLLQKIMRGGKYIEKRCDSSDTFETIVATLLAQLGIEFRAKEVSSTKNSGGDAKISAGFVSASLDSHAQATTKVSHQSSITSPSWVADQLRDRSGIFLIDEIDAIANAGERKKLAELVKLLSDNKSRLKVVMVGIAGTGSDLTAGHPSVQRCLKEVELKRMADDDIRKIIVSGFKKAGQFPTEDVIDRITDISAGLPHFTHLICLKCAEASVTSGNKHINLDVLAAALAESVKDSENALKDTYTNCVHSFNKPQEYKVILLGAAYCKNADFRAFDVLQQLADKIGLVVDAAVITRRLTAISRKECNRIVEKSGRGHFRFTDPRMPSFVKMVYGVDKPSANEKAPVKSKAVQPA